MKSVLVVPPRGRDEQGFQPAAPNLILRYSSACQPLEAITQSLKPSFPIILLVPLNHCYGSNACEAMSEDAEPFISSSHGQAPSAMLLRTRSSSKILHWKQKSSICYLNTLCSLGNGHKHIQFYHFVWLQNIVYVQNYRRFRSL